MRLAAPDTFADFVSEHGLIFHPMGVDVQEMLRRPEVRGAVAGPILGAIRIWREVAVPVIRATLAATWAAASDTDVIVYHPKVAGAPDVAERTGATLVLASPVPIFPTRAFPIILTGRDFGGRLNRIIWAPSRLSRAPYACLLNAWRRQTLGLGKGPTYSSIGQAAAGMAMRLCAVSPTMASKPADSDDDTHMTGYWMLEEGHDWSAASRLGNVSSRWAIPDLCRSWLDAVAISGWFGTNCHRRERPCRHPDRSRRRPGSGAPSPLEPLGRPLMCHQSDFQL